MTKKRIKPNTLIGQVLERLTSDSLSLQGFDHHFDWQYDKDFVKVDVAHPRIDQPSTFAEITQTDMRDSIKRKALRYFELVSGVKINFGPDSLCGTIIYGNPARDLPEANLNASTVFFDFSIIPSSDSKITTTHKASIDAIEQEVSRLVGSGLDQSQIVSQIKSTHNAELLDLGKYILNEIRAHQASTAPKAIWRKSASATKTQPDLNKFYKSSILNCLFISESDFLMLEKSYKSGNMIIGAGVTDCVASHLEMLGLGRVVSTVGGKKLEIDNSIDFIINSPIGRSILTLCYNELKLIPTLHYFEDIWELDRRLMMADSFISAFNKGMPTLRTEILSNLQNASLSGIIHSRAWMADLIQIHLETSQNVLNNRVLNDTRYTVSIANPYNNIVIKSAAVVKPKNATIISDILSDLAYSKSKISMSRIDIAKQILEQRMEASMYLQMFNPLHLFVFDELNRQGWAGKKASFPSIISDLIGDGKTGKFRMIEAEKNGEKVVINLVAAKEGNDDHKSKEWASRGKAISLKYENGTLDNRDVGKMIFVCDGRWTSRSRKRLERAGWITCSLEEFPTVLSLI